MNSLTKEKKIEKLNEVITNISHDNIIRHYNKNREGFNTEAIQENIDENDWLLDIFKRELKRVERDEE